MGLQSAMEALPEAILPEQRASFMEDLSEQHLWAYLLQASLSYVAIFAIAGAMEPWQHHFFRQRNTEELRVTNPTQSDSYFMHLDRPRLRRPCTLFSGARVGWARFIAERDLSSQDWARAKVNAIFPPKLFLFRKKEWESVCERERERERESALQIRERVVAHISRLATLHPGAKPAFTVFYRAGAKELENTIYSPQLFLIRKKDFQRASMTGESSRKNLIILQAEAEKLSGFTPSIQPEAAGLGLYARCKTR